MATATGTISSNGIGSGLNVDDIVSKLMQVEQQPLVALQKREAQFTSQLTTLGTIKGTLSSFQTAAAALKSAGASPAFKLTSSDPSSVSGSASASAAAGAYLVSVTQLAQGQRLAAAGRSGLGDDVGDGTPSTVTLSFGNISGGTLDTNSGTYSGASFSVDPTRVPVQVQIDGSNNTLEGIRDAINAANAGVTAAVINDGSANPYRLTITSNTTGAKSSLRIDVSGNADLAALLGNDPAGTQHLSQTQAAQDAKLSISGLTINRSSNSVSDAIQGVTLKLTKVATDVAVEVERDSTNIISALQGIADSYNDANKAIKGATALQAVLQGDTSTVSVLNRLRSAIGANLAGNGAISSLSQLGLSFERDGSLSFDSAKAQAAIDAKPAAVSSVVASFGDALSKLADTLVGSGGAMDIRTDGINRSIADLNARGDTLSQRLTTIEARYRAQFTALDVLMSNMQSTSNFLTQQLANLPKTSSD